MRLILAALLAMPSTPAAPAAPAQPFAPLELRWQLKQDVFDGPRGASLAAFTLTNRDTKPLPGSGWAIYFNALHEPDAGERLRRLPHRGGDGRLAAARARRRLRRARAGPERRDRVPDRPPDEPQLRAHGSLRGVRRRARDRAAAPRVHGGPVRAAPAGRGPRPARGHAGGAVRARLRDPRHPGRRAAARVPDAAVRRAARGGPSCASPPMPAIVAGARPQGRGRARRRVPEPLLRQGPARGDGTAGAPAPRSSSRRATSRARARRRPTSSSSTRSRACASSAPRRPASSTGCSRCAACCRRAAPGEGSRRCRRCGSWTRRASATAASCSTSRATSTRRRACCASLDLLARYKLNALHLHLTEDEAWRLEIPSLPELTSVGARRGHTLDSSRWLPPVYGSGPASTARGAAASTRAPTTPRSCATRPRATSR